MSDDGAIPKIEGSLVKLKGIYIIYVFFNIKRGFYHLGDSCSSFLYKINIISAAGLWGINVSDEYFLVRKYLKRLLSFEGFVF